MNQLLPLFFIIHDLCRPISDSLKLKNTTNLLIMNSGRERGELVHTILLTSANLKV